MTVTSIAHVQCLADAVLVEPIPNPSMSAGGIILPDASQEVFGRGIVTHVGPAVTHVAVGDLVLFGKYAGTWLTLFGASRLSMREVELHLRIPAGTFAVVGHEGKFAHLLGEPCEVCTPQAQPKPVVDDIPQPVIDRSREWLEAERLRMVKRDA